MLDPKRWGRLDGLMFTATRLVEGLYAGAHPSPRHGAGVEFHDYRPYTPGDDLASVDWKLYGRTDRYYLRRHQRHTDLEAMLCVDVSASMAYGDASAKPASGLSKLTFAKELAAAIGVLLVRQSDRVGLALCGAKLRGHVPLGGTWSHAMQLCAALEQAEAMDEDEGPGDMGACLRQVAGLWQRRGVVVVISDALDEPGGLLDGISRLRHSRCDVIVFQVLTPTELDLSAFGDRRLRLLDSEGPLAVTTRTAAAAERYRQALRAHIETVRRGCVGRGADHVLMRTDRPVLEGLRGFLSKRAAR